MPTSSLSLRSVNSAGKLGATMATTVSLEARRSKVRSTSRKACLAFWEQTRKQLAQPMQREGITLAWPSTMRMASAGHSRTQA